MANDIKLYTRFDKTELLTVAEQLHISISGNPSSKGICEKLTNTLDNGVPDIAEEVSDVVFDFLEAGGWIDANGNILAKADVDDEDEEENAYEIHEKESDVIVDEEVKLPQCYGMEDDRDPSCKRCKVKEPCKVLRIANRPKCFGLMHDGREPECQVCIEEAACSPISEVYQKEGK
jgi:hypothetical protein